MQMPINRKGSKPAIALMGEFSAGKSTLANLLLGEGRSRVQVTATQSPPIWYTHGSGAAVRVDLEGTPSLLPEDQLHSVSVEDTAYVLVRSEAEVLELIDIIDTPGISDPNLSAESWRRTIHYADAVIWCTHATQAWRESEAAAWRELPESLKKNSFLLLTRFDKLLSEKDRERVVRRVAAETEGQFRSIHPISLLEATNAGDDRESWERSGAEPFMRTFLDSIFDIATEKARANRAAQDTDPGPGDELETRDHTAHNMAQQHPVTPKRVIRQKQSGGRSPRPPRSDPQKLTI